MSKSIKKYFSDDEINVLIKMVNSGDSQMVFEIISVKKMIPKIRKSLLKHLRRHCGMKNMIIGFNISRWKTL